MLYEASKAYIRPAILYKGILKEAGNSYVKPTKAYMKPA
jgi:hypothetical protein